MTRRIREPIDDRWQVSPRAAGGGRVPVGPRVGPIRITPTRVLLTLALIGSLAYFAYALNVRDASQIPLMSSGAAVLGLVFGGLAATGGYGVVQAGREGADGRAFALALLGGVCAIIAFGCFAAAVVLALVASRA
jgi:hypothetical protein